ncbi:RraA family protein [Acidisphaera sp. L21]|uniref:RraA family protein n=1 Tax=Acidisphaera sp. L21 TaxID=1641851 RepID=UPI00131ACC54|nr:RraA family protein [Acidisphaera sp. L21]
MIGQRRNPSAPLADPALIAEFKTAQTAIISDNLSRLPGSPGLRPFHKGGVMVGTALTVRTRGGDNLAIHEALALVRPGDVVVVDGGGDVSRALIGEIMMTIAIHRGAAGMVIDGAIRDVGAIAAGDFPVYARAAIHLGPYKNGPGEINVPVTIGGMVVEPGDIIVGDEDGIVAFPQSDAAELLIAVRKQEAKEADTLQSIREGRYTGGYGKQ